MQFNIFVKYLNSNFLQPFNELPSLSFEIIESEASNNNIFELLDSLLSKLLYILLYILINSSSNEILFCNFISAWEVNCI